MHSAINLSRRKFFVLAGATAGSLIVTDKSLACGFEAICLTTTDTSATLRITNLVGCDPSPTNILVKYQPKPVGDWGSAQSVLFAADFVSSPTVDVTVQGLSCESEYVFRVTLESGDLSTAPIDVEGCGLQCRPPGGCTYTQGYWKTHPNVWPVDSLMLGSRTYTKTALLNILNTAVAGNGLISLAHQLIAAKLNLATGATCPAAVTAIANADSIVGARIVGTDYLHPSATSGASGTLDQFNNGLLADCPTHCAS